MSYNHITEHCFDDRLGDQGVSKKRVDVLMGAIALALDVLRNRKNLTANPLLALPFRTHDIAEIEAVAKQISARNKHVVVAGCGGSCMSGQTLASLKPIATNPTLHFIDTIDPDIIGDLLEARDMNKTCFIVVSKSGNTVETLSLFYVLLEHVKQKLGNSYITDRFVIITQPGDNPLRRAATEYKLKIIDHDADIGGRFSILTPVGLLPAAAIGLNIRALREGAQSVVKELDTAMSPMQCRPAMGAALQYAFMEKGRNITVTLPYSERLHGLGLWFRQCWAESLGKSGKGSTPSPAIGPSDQHSQLQLYLDGPRDKFITMFTIKRAGSGHKVVVPDGIDELAYMRGKTTGDIMGAQQRATMETLVKKRVPVRVFDLEALNEEHMGALLMHFTLEIVFMSYLLNVNPFDQPAVEEGKQLAREYLLSGNV
jgi:glucose-6-phosphate isomerase